MQIGDKNIEFDKDGFMADPAMWDEAVARAIAGDEGIEDFSETHWAVVNYIREYWQENDLAPPVRMICKELGVSIRQLYKLFTSGPARGACRVAGLPKPDGCV
jgi:dissimilatory sulfite reductase related protein